MLDPIESRVRSALHMPDGGCRAFLRGVDAIPTIVGASSTLVPRPTDWPADIVLTGAWQLPMPQAWQPPTGLADFLAAGTPPIYVGFGSMSITAPEQLHDLATAAAPAAGVRLILGSSTLTGPLTDDIYAVSDIPHDWLFGRVRAAIHHGGAGTTHAALTAGIPQLAIPHIADQPYWGRRIAELMIGPRPIPLRDLTIERLTAGLAFVTDAYLTTRAAELGAVARAETGIANAVEALGPSLR